MIVDAIKNAELYYSLSPRIKQAFDWLAATDIAALEAGRHDIDGNNLFAGLFVAAGEDFRQILKLNFHTIPFPLFLLFPFL